MTTKKSVERRIFLYQYFRINLEKSIDMMMAK